MGQTTSQEYAEAYNAAMGKQIDGRPAIRISALVVGCLQIIAGAIAIMGWSEMLNFTWGNVQHPVIIGAGIWIGFYALFPGMFGVFVYLQLFSISLRVTFFYVHFGMTMGMTGLGVCLALWSYEVWQGCRLEEPMELCGSAPESMTAMGIMCFIMALVLLASVVAAAVYYALVVGPAGREAKAEGRYTRTR